MHKKKEWNKTSEKIKKTERQTQKKQTNKMMEKLTMAGTDEW